jgi:ABC-2 type transport system permease protein
MRMLSGGMKRRVLVAQALVHRPPVIVLDEPTAGVDVELRQGLWQFIRKLNRDGHTIVLTTHYLEEAEALCGRIAMLKAGRVVALDTTANLLRASPPTAWRAPRSPGARRRARRQRRRGRLGGLRLRQLRPRSRPCSPACARRRRPRRDAARRARSRTRLRRGDAPCLFVPRIVPRIEPMAAESPLAGFRTLLYKEVLRFWKVSFQTVAAPVLNALLFLLIFSHVLDRHVTVYPARSAYTSLPGARAGDDVGAAERLRQQLVLADPEQDHRQHHLRAAAAAVLPRVLRRLRDRLDPARADGGGGRARGVGRLRRRCRWRSPLWVLAFAVLGGAILGSLGVIAGIWADKFDQLAAFQNFLIMPLTMLSGVFYSIHSLPQFWQDVSHFNPFFFMIDGFRYGFFGQSDTSPWTSLGVVGLCFVVLAALTLAMLARGYKLRS